MQADPKVAGHHDKKRHSESKPRRQNHSRKEGDRGGWSEIIRMRNDTEKNAQPNEGQRDEIFESGA